MSSTRRDFVRKTALAGAGFAMAAGLARAGTNTAERTRGALYMGDFVAPQLPIVRCALIGVGARGSAHARQLALIEGTEIVAISDLYQDLAEASAMVCREAGAGERHRNIGLYYGGEQRWQNMLDEVRPDAVFISTPWETHAVMAINTMAKGAHAFVEVPMAVTVDELWQIIDASERNQKHCMMMENVNYGREELLYLNMCRQGVIGEILHGEAAYIHDLRFQMAEQERGTGSWRTPHYAIRNGNLYPTHGLGPVAQYMSLARGEDSFERMVSMSSPAAGRQIYASEHYPPEHKWNQLRYRGGDINTSIIQTVNGRTIMIQWDETSPRPYTRHNLVQGTRGTLTGFPARAALEGGIDGATEDHHNWAQANQLQQWYEKYEHPLFVRLGELSKRMGGHGGMDFMMLYRIVECLRQGAALDQNVYEGGFWSAVAPLSEASVAQDGMPQAFPDFTRGEWHNTRPLDIVG